MRVPGLSQQAMHSSSPGEGVPGIVHDAVEIVCLTKRLHLFRLHLQEVVLLPCGNGGRQSHGQKAL